MLEPRGKGIVLWTLRYGDEVRDEETYFEDIGDETADSDMMPLIQQLIKKQTPALEPENGHRPGSGPAARYHRRKEKGAEKAIED